MIARAVLLLTLLGWGFPASGEGSNACAKAEESRAASVGAVDSSCTGAIIDALSCFSAARILVRTLENLDTLQQGPCPTLDRAAVNGDLERARKTTALAGREAAASLAAQLAADRAVRLGYDTFKSYVCLEIVTHFAVEASLPGDRVRTGPVYYLVSETSTLWGSRWLERFTGKWAPAVRAWFDGPVAFRKDLIKQFRIGTVRYDYLCGIVTLKVPPAVDEQLYDPFDPTGMHSTSYRIEQAYLRAKEKIHLAAIGVSKELLPKDGALSAKDREEIDAVVLGFAHEVSELIRANDNGDPERSIRMKDAVYIPKVRGPALRLLAEDYTEASEKYATFSKWLEGTIQR